MSRPVSMKLGSPSHQMASTPNYFRLTPRRREHGNEQVTD